MNCSTDGGKYILKDCTGAQSLSQTEIAKIFTLKFNKQNT